MFQIRNPDTGIDWLDTIKPSDIRNLRRLCIYVHAVYNPGPHPDFLTNNPPNGPRWRELLEKPFTEAECLEEWCFRLIQNLLSITGVQLWMVILRERLEIRGYFPKEWLGYLEKRTGLWVWQEKG
ncbi:hypothetical protein N7489_003274 [Penicillium chrysogenum]|jgi:hypothetical protein|uniref:uncharacterized protein n=1 Tax=Penicillium chrysogenum TaxID=5076 RepID=UPI0024DF1733|nr:uncharacterized protein N7489_003274 [Penicillium chrysogenum]KAJ5252864.1 hypothetical protein N7489_003274 [Penicillium chrysogenum]